uniref:Uncharacterized protein n=1 Tax=Cannabis sativa TaxID=3483 RepID=A0A803PEH0_CANSA
MSFYSVIQEIWKLDYSSFRILVFLYGWVRNDDGINDDEFGFKLVDLNRIGHKSDGDETNHFKAGEKWRDWKNILTTGIFKFKDRAPHLLEKPLRLYEEIIDEDKWKEFVALRLSTEFAEKRKKPKREGQKMFTTIAPDEVV